jgi:hypothetical protein
MKTISILSSLLLYTAVPPAASAQMLDLTAAGGKVNGDLTIAGQLAVDAGGGSHNAYLILKGWNAGTPASAQIFANWLGGIALQPSSPDATVTIGADSPVNGNTLAVYGRAAIGTSFIGTTAPANGLIVQGNVGIGMTDPANFGRLTILQTGTGFGSQGVIVTTGAINEGVALSDSGTSGYKMLQSYGGALALNPQGNNVGVGTTTPGYLLTVNGPVRASQFIADVGTYSDFVFKADYRLAPLSEVAAAIARDGHLPGIPGEAEAKRSGLDVMAMQVKLLQKVEELTLYAIEQDKRFEEQAAAIKELREENLALRTGEPKRAGR